MANAKLTTRTVSKPVEVDEVTLILSVEEAKTLRFIMERVGGDPKDTPRSHADAISMSLAGVVDRPDFYTTKGHSAIYFARKGDPDATRS